jgi:hypothetical protein
VKIDSTHPEFENFIRAFWRRIEPYKNDFEKELPKPMPVQFRASMETAFLQFNRGEVTVKKQLAKNLFASENTDGTWLHFSSEKGPYASICLDVTIGGSIARSAIKAWIAEADEYEDTDNSEGHTIGHLSIENIDEVQKMDLTNVDLGMKVSNDRRFWLCVNEVSFLRFKEKSNG